MDYEDMEAAVLKGFVRDRQLITIALNQGFSPELLPSPVARRLCNAMIDLYLARGGEVVSEVTVRNHLETQGVLNAEMEHYLRAVLAAGSGCRPSTSSSAPSWAGGKGPRATSSSSRPRCSTSSSSCRSAGSVSTSVP